MYNEEAGLDQVLQEIHDFVSENRELTWEVLIIDDGSTDLSSSIARDWVDRVECFHLIALSRNFGHQEAIRCGLNSCTGDAAVVIDADLQDPLDAVLRLVQRWIDSKSEVVYGIRASRKGDRATKRFFSWLFYRFFAWISETPIPPDVGDFRLISRKVLEHFKSFDEPGLYVRGAIPWLGFETETIEYHRARRVHGESGYPFHKSLGLSLQAVSGFSTRPLKFVAFLGLFSTVPASAYLTWVIWRALTGHTIEGWASAVAIQLTVSSTLLLVLGVVAIYLARVVEQTRGRPMNIVKSDSREES